jgi:hypothetical protein
MGGACGTCAGQEKTEYSVLVPNGEIKRRNVDWGDGVGEGKVAGCCEDGNELSGCL